MAKAPVWVIAAVAAVVILGVVGWIVWSRPSDGSTRIVTPAAPDAASIAQPLPGQQPTAVPGAAGGTPAVDAQGGAVIR